MKTLHQIQDMRIALMRFEGEAQLELDEIIAQAKADARRAALETLKHNLCVRMERYRSGILGSYPEAQAARMTMEDAAEMVDDETSALLTPAVPLPKCPRCAGTGNVGDYDDQQCPKCNGTGRAL